MNLINIICSSTLFFSYVNSKPYLRADKLEFLDQYKIDEQEILKHYLLDKERIKNKEIMDLERYKELKPIIDKGVNNGSV